MSSTRASSVLTNPHLRSSRRQRTWRPQRRREHRRHQLTLEMRWTICCRCLMIQTRRDAWRNARDKLARQDKMSVTGSTPTRETSGLGARDDCVHGDVRGGHAAYGTSTGRRKRDSPSGTRKPSVATLRPKECVFVLSAEKGLSFCRNGRETGKQRTICCHRKVWRIALFRSCAVHRRRRGAVLGAANRRRTSLRTWRRNPSRSR